MRTVQECLRRAEQMRRAAEDASPLRRQQYVDMEAFWRSRAESLQSNGSDFHQQAVAS